MSERNSLSFYLRQGAPVTFHGHARAGRRRLTTTTHHHASNVRFSKPKFTELWCVLYTLFRLSSESPPAEVRQFSRSALAQNAASTGLAAVEDVEGEMHDVFNMDRLLKVIRKELIFRLTCSES